MRGSPSHQRSPTSLPGVFSVPLASAGAGASFKIQEKALSGPVWLGRCSASTSGVIHFDKEVPFARLAIADVDAADVAASSELDDLAAVADDG